jgi:hypothetical protein
LCEVQLLCLPLSWMSQTSQAYAKVQMGRQCRGAVSQVRGGKIGGKANILNKKTGFLNSTNFKLLIQVK